MSIDDFLESSFALPDGRCHGVAYYPSDADTPHWATNIESLCAPERTRVTSARVITCPWHDDARNLGNDNSNVF